MLQSRRPAYANRFALSGCTYRRGDFPAPQWVGPKVAAAIVSAVAISWIIEQTSEDHRGRSVRVPR
jgi:hypothetical protein